MAEAVAAISSYSAGTSVTLADVPYYRLTEKSLRSDFGNEYSNRDARRNPAPVDAATARTAIASAVNTGDEIVARLEQIQNAIQYARYEGVVGPDQYYRQPRQAQVALLLADIDRAVANSEVSGVNLLSSDSRAYRFQTTDLGGAVNVNPQALDVRGLGLTDLKLISDSDIAIALDKVGNAIEFAKSRTLELNNLGVNVAQAADFLTQIVGENYADRNPTVRLPAGSILDLMA